MQEGTGSMGFRTDTRDGFTALAAAQRAGYRAAFVITTNLRTRHNGAAVMGAGLAKAAVQRSPGIDFRYGHHLHRGERVVVDGDFILFPTKVHWKEQADLALIAVSSVALRDLVQREGYDFVLIPRVGCGLGGRDWEREVRPMVESILAPLADRVIFVR